MQWGQELPIFSRHLNQFNAAAVVNRFISQFLPNGDGGIFDFFGKGMFIMPFFGLNIYPELLRVGLIDDFEANFSVAITIRPIFVCIGHDVSWMEFLLECVN